MLSWKFALYSLHKSRDGIELEWHLCNMQGIPNQVNLIREFLLKKPVADKPVAQYSPFLSDKQSIGALENDNEMIHSQLWGIFAGIRNGVSYSPIDFVTGRLPKIVGYAFFGEHNSENDDTDITSNENTPVLFMRRGNPFMTGSSLYMGTEDEIVVNNAPIIKLASTVDFLSIDGASYIFSSSIEKDLAFENRYFAIAEKCLEKIAAAEIIGDYDRFESAVMRAKNAKKFLDFNEEVLDYIVGLPIMERIDYLEKFGVELDKGGRMDSYEFTQSELIIDLLCGRSCLDPLNRLSTGSNIMPRE
jgi:hypothetical protein